MSDIPKPPPGFVIQNQPATSSVPPPPAGFVLAPLERPKPSGQHLTFEEGQRLLAKEEQAGVKGAAGAGMTGFIDGFPVVGPYMLSGVQKAAAGISSMIDGESYDQNLAQAQQITKDAQEQHPIVTGTGEVAGAVAGTLPMIAAAPSAFGVGASSTPMAMLASGGSGAVIGGADAAVRSDGDLGATLTGAGIGGGLGLAGPLVGDLAGRAYNNIFAGRAAKKAAEAAGTSKAAVDVTSRALAADQAMTATNANIAAAGKEAMLADAGPSVQNVLDTAIQKAGPGAGKASERINARLGRESARMTGALDEAMGKPGESLSRELIVYGDKQNPTSLLYKKAYATPIDYADPRAMDIEQMVKSRVPASAIKAANDLMRVEGESSRQILAKIGDDGSVVFEQLPDVRQLDYITRGLKQVAEEADGKGKLGGTTPIGRAYGNLARDIRSNLKELVPDYKAALDRAGTEIGKVEAEKFGGTILSDAVSREDVKRFASDLPMAERNKMMEAIRQDIDDRMARVKAAFTDNNMDAREAASALKTLSSRANREKVEMAIGQTRAKKAFDTLDEVMKSFELKAGLAQNSKTFARQNADRAVKDITAPGIVETAAEGSPLQSARKVVQGVFNTGEPAQLARQDQVWNDIADLLTRPASEGGGMWVQAIDQTARQLPQIQQRAGAVGNAVNRGTAISAAPVRRQFQSK